MSAIVAASSTCRSCGAAVTWHRNHLTNWELLDAEPRDDGNRWIDDSGISRPVDLFTPKDVDRFASHFATCPDADRWRDRCGR